MADYGRVVYFGLFAAFVAFTAKDILQGTQSADEESKTPVKEIPNPKLSRFTGPTLTVMYCYSWGYRKVYEQYAVILHEKYPDLTVQGDHYPPPHIRLHIAHFLGVAKLVLILLVIASLNPFQSFGMPTPNFYTWCLENKIYACMMIFFLSNFLEGQLISTGAFEISFNDVPVWSKLETGRIPNPPELFQIIDSNLRFSTSGPAVGA